MTGEKAESHTGADLVSHRQVMIALSGLMVGLFIAALDQTIVATAIPAIVTDLGGIRYLSWIVVGYLLTSTASTPLWGKVGDLYGRRRMFQVAIVVFIAGSLICGAAPTMATLIAGRLVQGIGGGGLYALCFGIVGDLVPPRQRGKYISYFAGMFAFAGVIGPLVGGVFTDHLTWRWIFTVNLPIGVASLVVTSLTLKLPTVRRVAKVDVVGAALLVVGVVSAILASVWGGDEYAWGSVQIVGLFAGALAMLLGFVAWEAKAQEPILPLHLFRNRVVALLLATGFLVGPVFYAIAAFIPLMLQAVKGFTATESGLMLAPHAVGLSVTAVITGRLTTRTGRYKHWVIVGAVLIVAGLVVLSRLDANWRIPAIVVVLFGVGMGLGSLMPVLSAASQNAVELKDLGVVTAAVTFFRTLGGTFGIAAFGAVLRARFDTLLNDIVVADQLPAGTTARSLADRPADIATLAEPLRGLVQEALTRSIAAVFFVAVPFGLAVLLLGTLLEELPLRDTTAHSAAASDAASSDAAKGEVAAAG